MVKKCLLVILFIVILYSALFSDGGGDVPVSIINLQVKDHGGNFIDNANVQCRIWLNDSYDATLYDFSNGNYHYYLTHGIAYHENGGAGIIALTPNILFTNPEPGDIVHFWIKKSNATIEEGTISVPLTDENMIALTGDESLYLTDKVITQSSTYTYTFNGYTRDNSEKCQVEMTMPSGTSGELTIGLLNTIPGTMPGETTAGDKAVNFGFYFDSRVLTYGTGNVSIKIKWSSDIGLLTTDGSNQGLYISYDGIYWINSLNSSAYYTVAPVYNLSETTRAITGDVTIEFSSIPQYLIFGNGASSTTSYVETTPPQPVGLEVTKVENNLNLKWNKSPQPGVTYGIQSFTGGSWDDVTNPPIGEESNKKTYSATFNDDDSEFYRVKVSPAEGSSSYSQPMGYVKYGLSDGWNMVGYTMGENGCTVDSLYNVITGIQANGIKIWNVNNQCWDSYADGSTKTLGKGDVFLVNVSGTQTWHSIGTAYSSYGEYSYNFEFNESGYNMIILPFNKASLTTTSALFNDIFPPSRFTIDHTISWYDVSEGAYITYDGGDIGNNFDSNLRVGIPLIVHVAESDDITWPSE